MSVQSMTSSHSHQFFHIGHFLTRGKGNVLRKSTPESETDRVLRPPLLVTDETSNEIGAFSFRSSDPSQDGAIDYLASASCIDYLHWEMPGFSFQTTKDTLLHSFTLTYAPPFWKPGSQSRELTKPGQRKQTARRREKLKLKSHHS